MNSLTSRSKRLSLLLFLISLHSILVGLGLIIQNPSMMEFAGYEPCQEHFFPAQGGVFHLIMAFGYALAATHLKRYQSLVLFFIFVKGVATLFLFTYYILIENIWIILFSAISDGLMMICLIFAWRAFELAENIAASEN